MNDSTTPRSPRLRKASTWGLVFTAMIVGYLLSIGPWIYIYPDLPPQVQQFVRWLYFWMDWAYNSDAFRESAVGGLYIDYVNWWKDLRYTYRG